MNLKRSGCHFIANRFIPYHIIALVRLCLFLASIFARASDLLHVTRLRLRAVVVDRPSFVHSCYSHECGARLRSPCS
jgi:hypothetical protein